MNRTIFLEIEFWGLILFTIILPAIILGWLIMKSKITRQFVATHAVLLLVFSCIDVILLKMLRAKANARHLQNTSALTPISSRNSVPRYHPQYGVWNLSLTYKPDSLILLHTKRKFLSTIRRYMSSASGSPSPCVRAWRRYRDTQYWPRFLSQFRQPPLRWRPELFSQ